MEQEASSLPMGMCRVWNGNPSQEWRLKSSHCTGCLSEMCSEEVLRRCPQHIKQAPWIQHQIPFKQPSPYDFQQQRSIQYHL